MTVAAVAGLLAVLLCAAGLLGHLDRPLAASGRAWRRLRLRPARPVRPGTVPVERIAADLRRLADLVERTYATDQPAKMERLRAASLAYDQVLLAACRTLEVPSAQTPPLRPLERLVAEADLARSGLDW